MRGNRRLVDDGQAALLAAFMAAARVRALASKMLAGSHRKAVSR